MEDLSPMDVKNFDEVCALRRDNFSTKEHWIITDGNTVTVYKRKDGEPAVEKVTMSRKEFNRLVKWYIKPQKRRNVI